MGWKIVNGFKIIANFHCTVNDIWNMFILDGGKTHHADLPRQVHIKRENIYTMQHPMRTDLFPPISYVVFHNHVFTTSYFFDENAFYIWAYQWVAHELALMLRHDQLVSHGFAASAAALAMKCLSRNVRRLESNEAKIPAGAVIHLTSVPHSLGIIKVIPHCHELSLRNYPIGG